MNLKIKKIKITAYAAFPAFLENPPMAPTHTALHESEMSGWLYANGYKPVVIPSQGNQVIWVKAGTNQADKG